MKNMTIWNIARACKGHLAVPAGKHTGTCPAAGMAVIRGYSGKEAAGIVIDSRKVEPGDIFVAIRGERVDGHQFIREVFNKGAIAVVCEEEPEELPGPCIRVEDSLAALRQIAAFYREQMPIPIVGITGSVGKTSTKEFVASVLAQKYKTHKTQGNFNNEIGVPLTLLAMPEDTEAGQIQGFLEHYTGNMVCSKQLFKEALGHTFDQPKRWQLHNINEIMNTVVTGWKPFSNPRMFAGYGRQKGWECDNFDNKLSDNEGGFVELSEEECRQLELPKEWIA